MELAGELPGRLDRSGNRRKESYASGCSIAFGFHVSKVHSPDTEGQPMVNSL